MFQFLDQRGEDVERLVCVPRSKDADVAQAHVEIRPQNVLVHALGVPQAPLDDDDDLIAIHDADDLLLFISERPVEEELQLDLVVTIAGDYTPYSTLIKTG